MPAQWFHRRSGTSSPLHRSPRVKRKSSRPWRLANTRLKQDRLTDPPAGNAHYYFSRLFALDGEKGLKGFKVIAARYLESPIGTSRGVIGADAPHPDDDRAIVPGRTAFHEEFPGNIQIAPERGGEARALPRR